jgi:hypothetical protein
MMRTRRSTRPPNKELKLTKPSIMELRSLTPVFDAYVAVERGLRTEHDLPDQPGKTLELREYGAQA